MNILDRFKKITTFIFDMDGVLTDGNVLVLENGVQARRMSIRDGYALQLAVKKGYRLLVVSGANSLPVTDRLNKLGINEVYMSVANKKALVEKYIADNNLGAEQILYMGDDIPDYSVMSMVGLPVCPADAVAEIRAISKYISPATGGNGCVRDVIEQVLKLNDHWHHEADVASK
jgi:3-deoxy-D-manno-octulosonate 8-phosphate phosphatase (KDO 8-P phosphatase)